MLISESVRIDLVAILCMLALGWTGILTPDEMLQGFSSNAVIVVMAVMIMGRAIDRAGILNRFSHYVLQWVGNDKQRIILWVSLAIGLLSGFIQNIGAIALFLPAVIIMARRSRIAIAELIMPIGFAAILGGTLTMIGSGPLVLVNDFLHSNNLETFSMFTVTPLGLLLLLSGIVYFYYFGEKVLPKEKRTSQSLSAQEKLIQKLHLPNNIGHFLITKSSPLIGKTAEKTGIWRKFSVHILGISKHGEIEYSPWRGTIFKEGQSVALLGVPQDIENFVIQNKLIAQDKSDKFSVLHDPDKSGFAEVIIPQRSELAGKTIRQYSIRRRYGVEPVMLFSNGKEIRGDISDRVLKVGDSIIVHGLWERIADLKASIDFVVASIAEGNAGINPKGIWTILFFIGAVFLGLLGFPVSLAFLTGAILMMITGALSVQEMYEAIDWKVVFLLAGLIPLGVAMQKTGTANFLAELVFNMISGRNTLLLVITVGVLSTLFSLIMSNVGAMVVLAPVIIEMAVLSNLDPRPLVLMTAVCAANSFILPTHQVNAFSMSAGGYRNADYFRAGIWMTMIFLTIAVGYFYLLLLRSS